MPLCPKCLNAAASLVDTNCHGRDQQVLWSIQPSLQDFDTAAKSNVSRQGGSAATASPHWRLCTVTCTPLLGARVSATLQTGTASWASAENKAECCELSHQAQPACHSTRSARARRQHGSPCSHRHLARSQLEGEAAHHCRQSNLRTTILTNGRQLHEAQPACDLQAGVGPQAQQSFQVQVLALSTAACSHVGRAASVTLISWSAKVRPAQALRPSPASRTLACILSVARVMATHTKCHLF